MTSLGSTTLPNDFDILFPLSSTTKPCTNNDLKIKRKWLKREGQTKGPWFLASFEDRWQDSHLTWISRCGALTCKEDDFLGPQTWARTTGTSRCTDRPLRGTDQLIDPPTPLTTTDRCPTKYPKYRCSFAKVLCRRLLFHFLPLGSPEVTQHYSASTRNLDHVVPVICSSDLLKTWK